MEISDLIQTCGACPSQWECKTSNNRLMYVRYRWGSLSVSLSPVGSEDVMEAVSGKEIFYDKIGSAMSGDIEWEEVWDKIKDLDENELMKD